MVMAHRAELLWDEESVKCKNIKLENIYTNFDSMSGDVL